MKISQKLNKELNRAVRNYNAKIRRLEKANAEVIPKKVTVTDIKERIKNPAELRNEIKSLKRFSRKGAEKVYITKSGIKTTVWERREFGISVRSAKVKMLRELQKLEKSTVSVFGVDVRKEHSIMGSSAINTLKAQIEQISTNRFENATTSQDIARLKDLTRKYAYRYGMAKKFTFRENYIQMIDELSYDITPEEKEELINEMRELTPTEFYDMFSTDEGIQEILLRYKALTDGFDLIYSASDKELLTSLKNTLLKVFNK